MNACIVLLGLAVGCAPGPALTVPPPPMAAALPAPADRWLAEDKARHFAMSFAVTGMAYGAARVGLEPSPARAAAVGMAVALGIGKEVADVRGGGPFSFKDLAWDAAGVALGYALVQRIR